MIQEENQEEGWSSDQADLLAELLGDKQSGIVQNQIQIPSDENQLLSDILGENALDEKTSRPAFGSIVGFELVMPNWNMSRLTRSFHTVFKEIEEAFYHAEEWVEKTETLLCNLLNEVPEVWPERDANQITSHILGKFYAISQHFPVAQYLDLLSNLETIPENFPLSVEAKIPEEFQQEQKKSSSLWHVLKRSKKLGHKSEVWGMSTKVRLRWIGMYWLKYQHRVALAGTIRDAGDFYFLFLKSIQRLFDLKSQTDMIPIKEEIYHDILLLGEQLRSSHRTHLMHIYYGFESALRNALTTWNALPQIKVLQFEKQLKTLEKQNTTRLQQYSRALEFTLEDFHIRLQFFQIQTEALRLFHAEMHFVRRQFSRLEKQLLKSMAEISAVIPDDVQEWKELNEYMFSFRMEKTEVTFYDTINQIRKIFSQILKNSRTNNLVDLLLGRYSRIAQTLPEHANIVHLDKLWSWTGKKIEIDEGVPLRYTTEQFFYTQLQEPLHQKHHHWLRSLSKWSQQIEQQDQFFHFSFYSLRQQSTDTLSGWKKADRDFVYSVLKESAGSVYMQLHTIHHELEREFTLFEEKLTHFVDATVEDLEEVIFDPGLRQRLLRIASEGGGVASSIANFFLKLGEKNWLNNLLLVHTFILTTRFIQKHWTQIRKKFAPPLPLEETPVPAYYHRVFTAEPLEIRSLFVGREKEIETLRTIWHGRKEGRRSVIGLIGMPGIGKRSFINHCLHNEIETSSVHVTLVLIEEEIQAKINHRRFSLDRMVRKVQLDSFHVVILEGLESCFVETSGGARLLKKFFRWLQNATNKVVWIVSINELAWNTMKLFEEVGGVFTNILHLPPFTEQELKHLLYQRHAVVGIPLQFQTPKTTYFQLMKKYRPQQCQQQLESNFFIELAKRSHGNPAVSQQLWVQQCKLLENHSIRIAPFENEARLPELGEEELLILRIIFSQGVIAPFHLQSAVVSSKYLRMILDQLKILGLILIAREEQYTVFYANPEAYYTIYRLLQKEKLLQ